MGVNRHPFVKDKWDERAYFLVQDVLYEGMDDGHVSVNAGISDLAILAFIRATCSRPGALSKDWFDMSGAIAKWARGHRGSRDTLGHTYGRTNFTPSTCPFPRPPATLGSPGPAGCRGPPGPPGPAPRVCHARTPRGWRPWCLELGGCRVETRDESCGVWRPGAWRERQTD